MDKKEFLEKLLSSHWEEGEEVGTLLEVSSWHGRSLSPGDLPGDMSIDDPVRRWRRGYNHKRPSYVIRTASGRLFPACGTFFGQNSKFWLSKSVLSLYRGEWESEIYLTPEQKTKFNFLPDPPEEAGS